jgi:hypothetical protein
MSDDEQPDIPATETDAVDLDDLEIKADEDADAVVGGGIHGLSVDSKY